MNLCLRFGSYPSNTSSMSGSTSLGTNAKMLMAHVCSFLNDMNVRTKDIQSARLGMEKLCEIPVGEKRSYVD